MPGFDLRIIMIKKVSHSESYSSKLIMESKKVFIVESEEWEYMYIPNWLDIEKLLFLG